MCQKAVYDGNHIAHSPPTLKEGVMIMYQNTILKFIFRFWFFLNLIFSVIINYFKFIIPFFNLQRIAFLKSKVHN